MTTPVPRGEETQKQQPDHSEGLDYGSLPLTSAGAPSLAICTRLNWALCGPLLHDIASRSPDSAPRNLQFPLLCHT